MDEVLTLIGVACVVAMAWILSAAVRVVPPGHHVVVTRAGVKVRSQAGGIVVSIPGMERIHSVPTHPPPIDPLVVHATTRDGVEVQLVLNVLYRVADAAAAVEWTRDIRSATADAVERELRHLVGHTDLTDLLQDRELCVARLAQQPSPFLGPAGVELEDIDLLEVEIKAGAQLLRLLAPSRR